MDDLIDRELRRALAVAPSPEFVARVRTKIAEAPNPSMVPGVWTCAAALACVAGVAIGVGVREHASITARLKPSTTVVSNTSYPPLTPTPFQSRGTVAVTNFSPQQHHGEPLEASARADRSSKAHTENSAAQPPAFPEVIVAPADVEALRQHLANINNAQFVAFVAPAPMSTEWVTTEWTIPPLTINPLEPAPTANN